MSGSENTPAAPAAAPARKLETRITRVRLRELSWLKEGDDNARYMEKAEFDRLVENIRRDGCLTSLPLVYRGKVYSGNHRGQAAMEALGPDAEADCIEILSELSAEELLAIQLSHNSIAGKDDPSVLAKLFASFTSLDLKAYSGLSDDLLKASDEKLASMGMMRPKYESLELVFLPEEAAAFTEMLARIEKLKRQPTVLCGTLETFDQLFDATVKTKERRNIINNATALLEMARITLRVLEMEAAATAGAK